MRKSFFKKMLAGMLVGTMVLGTNVTVGATDVKNYDTESDTASANVSGDLEGAVNSSVVKMVLPTSEAVESTFAFNIDPQDLIKSTEAAKYPDTEFSGSGNVYFQNASGQYSDKSNKLTVTNKGTVDVDVTISAQAKNASGVNLVSSASDLTNNASGMYLGLVTASGNEAAITETAASGNYCVGGKAENYAPKYASGNYSYEIKTDSGWNGFAFGLTGAVDVDETNAYWTDESIVLPTVEVTWSYSKADGSNDYQKLTDGTIVGADSSEDASGGDTSGGTSDEGTSDGTTTDKLVVASDGSATYTFSTKPTGTLTVFSVDGTVKPGPVTNGKVTYDESTGVLTIASDTMTNFVTDTTVIVVTIGGTEYTLTR